MKELNFRKRLSFACIEFFICTTMIMSQLIEVNDLVWFTALLSSCRRFHSGFRARVNALSA